MARLKRRDFLAGAFCTTASLVACPFVLTKTDAQDERLGRSRFIGGLYVQMGTSITAGLRAPDAYRTPAIVGERLGIPAVNVGFEGSCAGPHVYPNFEDLSLYRLADAIVSRDWSRQEGSWPDDETKSPIIAKFKKIDFGKVSHLGLEYGTNDFKLAMPIGSTSDATGETFKGAINYSIRRLLTAFPALRLFLITPAWQLNQADLDSDSHPNSAGIFLREYVDAMLDVSAVQHVPCCDMWRTLGINKFNYKSYAFDGTHPNAAGAERRGNAIASFMNSVF